MPQEISMPCWTFSLPPVEQGSAALESQVSMHGGSPDIQTRAGSSAGPAALGLWCNPSQGQDTQAVPGAAREG